MIDAGSNGWVVRSLRQLVLLFSRLFFRIEFEGLENVPVSGPAILAANHQSYLDPILMSAPIRRRIRYMAWSELFRFRILRWLLETFGAFPVRVGVADKHAIRQSLETLRQGEMLMIFPEGQRSPDGRLLPFKVGFARLALLARVPVVPVAIRGAHRAWPPSRPFPLPAKIRIRYFPPLSPHEWEIEDEERRGDRLHQLVFDRIQEGLK